MSKWTRAYLAVRNRATVVMLAKGMTMQQLYDTCTKKEDPLTFIQQGSNGEELRTTGEQLYNQFVYLAMDFAQAPA